jgi:DNA-binding CsgD family transcriptional regulator
MNLRDNGTDRVKSVTLPVAGLTESYQDVLSQPGAARVRVVRGRGVVSRQLRQLQRSAKRELLVLDKPPYVLEPSQSQALIRRDLLSRGVRCRTVYDRGALDSALRLRGIRELAAAGELNRVFTGVPMKLLIVDRNVAAVLHLPTESEMVVVHPCTMLDGLHTLFELLWAQAATLPQDDTADPAGSCTLLSADERHLLGLAAAGFTDQAVARKLGVAQRTVERRMRRIMDRLGARTRFQAGLQAARRGVVAPSPSGPATPARVPERRAGR